MSDEIRFTGAKGKEIKFEVDKKVKNKLDKNDKKAFKPLFDAIENFDGKKGISAEEFKMLKDLQTIFAKTGVNQGTTGYILDADDAKIASEFTKSGKNIKDFIADKLAEITTPKETTPAVENKEPVEETPVQETVAEEVRGEQPVEEVQEPPKKTVVTQESRNQSFNRAMQNSAKRYNAQELGFTQEVEIKSGMYLSKIAKKALQDEGVQNPTARQLNERIAQIVAMNPQIKDVNNIALGTKIKVGKGANAPAHAGQNNGNSTTVGSGTGTVPVEPSTSEYAKDPAKVTELLGADGAKYADAVKDKPELQQELANVYKYLKDKFDNDEYLTLDEQKIFDVLKTVVDKDGVTIAAKAAVAEVKDGSDNVTTPAQPEVFAKQMVTDGDGNTYYKGKLGGTSALKDVEFRAKDATVLDEFLAELKLADTDDKKTALFKKYAENSTDSELLKSIAQNTGNLKASAKDVIALINKSNLDVVYAMATDSFADTPEADGQPAVTDKTDVQNAIKSRIEAIMADPELRKLPENAKYLDKIKELNVTGLKTNFKAEGDAVDLGLTTAPENETEEAKATRLRGNLEKLTKLFETEQNKYTILAVIAELKDSNKIDKNDPDAKALVQKLLLTRDGDIIRNLICNEDFESDDTLIENDPVALKTMAAMYKEIRAKENAGEKLTQEEVNLKTALQSGFANLSNDLNGNAIRYDNSGLYTGGVWANNPQLKKDFNAEMKKAGDDAAKKQAVINKFINDSRVKEDENFRYYLANKQFENATPAEQKAIVELCDARALTQIDLTKLAGTDDEKKAVKEAYIAKAKELFNYAQAADGTKLDPSNARYMFSILNKIDSDEVKQEITSNFFVTEGEGENQTAKIKDFRRFTYEEMDNLANAVSKYGTDAQKKALADMITTDDMENGQFVRAIEIADLDDAVRDKYASFVDSMTTKEEVFALIDKMRTAEYHIPFDKIMEKFGDDPEVQATLLQKASFTNSVISNENRAKLAKSAMQVDGAGHITFDKTKLPEGVTVANVINILPRDCKGGDFAEMFKAILLTCDLLNEDIILLMNNHVAEYDNDMKIKLLELINQDEVKNGTTAGNEFVDCFLNVIQGATTTEDLYNIVTTGKKKNLIEANKVSDSHVLVKSGDTVDKIVKNYLKKHLDKFPRLKESVDSDPNKWTPARIEEALNDYMKDFRNDIMADLGITDPTKLKEGDIIELDKIKWTEHQPGWWNYNFTY